MELEAIVNDDPRMDVVEQMLIEIDGVTPQSLYNNDIRSVKSSFCLGFFDGEAICVVETLSENLTELMLMNFAITREFQGTGKGKQFLALVERSAGNNGYKSIVLTSYPDVYGFYLACGYLEQGASEYNLYKNL